VKINRNNYEVFFIDYYDDKLTTAQQLELELFLESNPDLKAEFEEFENIMIRPSGIAYISKSKLKKPEVVEVAGISEASYEEYFIAWYENDLNPSEKASLLQFLESNPQLEKEFQLHKTLQVPQQHIVFENKGQLKKRSLIAYYWSAAAAALLILLSIGYFLLQNQNAQQIQRFEIASMEKANISLVINTKPTSQLVLQQKDELFIDIPAPESYQMESINAIASVNLDDVSLQQHLPVFILEKELQHETMLVATAEQPKRRGLLAQFFKKNVEEFTADLSINTTPESEPVKKKDPGFVKFLDGSLAVFNTLTGSDTELVKSYDNEGNLSNYSLVGQTLLVNRNLPEKRTSP
jgi:hypothetical protein